MALQSGTIPYEYAIGGRRFASLPIPIGLSGILLEQAQFVITAEIRKWYSDHTYLPSFYVYTNINIPPSGPYEPKSFGTTLDNSFNPGAVIFLDNIYETRSALNSLFSFYASDSDMVDAYEYRKAWLQALYPESPSGFIEGVDDQVFTTTVGHWRHRYPSESGVIDYCSDEVLGSSGILYDIDFAEVMFNPAPHISSFGFNNCHGRISTGASDNFSIVQYPIWPCFQRTDGTLIDLTGREPSTALLPLNNDYETASIGSGYIRVYGYALSDQTEFILSTKNTFGATTDFTPIVEGIRSPYSQNLASTVMYLQPSAQASGVYRLAAVNRFADFPNTTIESGLFSHWPLMLYYWPSDPNNSTTTKANLGYQVFNDCLWMTDVNASASTAGPNFGRPSGLALLSPFTGHRLWVRYADQTPTTITPLFSSVTRNWSTAVGLERIATDFVYRAMPTIQKATTNVSGQFKFAQYNDTLDYVTDLTTTSTYFNGLNEVPLGGNISTINDFWFDGTYYWISNSVALGVDMWKFDSSFQYVTKYIFNRPSGINDARGAYINGKNVIFYGSLNAASTNFAGSGIFPMNIITDGTDPFDNSANAPEVGEIEISYATAKYINAAPFLGLKSLAEIMDIVEVSSATHVYPGIYAIVAFGTTFTNRILYLMRIEESSTAWEVASITRLDTSVGSLMPRRDLVYIPY